MSHHSNTTFTTILSRLDWSVQRSARALGVGEDDLLAWKEGRRRVPDRILDILRKFEDIYDGKPAPHTRQKADQSGGTRGPHQTHQDEHDNIKKEKLHLIREAYAELAREYLLLAELTPGGLETSFGPYAVLGVLPGTPWKKVKAQYHALSKAHHPDRGGDEEIMKDISMAYTTLRLIYGE